MLQCTYIVLLNNNESNISLLIKSLKEISGSFRKEFIIIDDGSKDNSLELVKLAANDLPRTTIITQKNQGWAININKAITLANGDYIHFVEGSEVLYPESTKIMIDSCLQFNAEVSCANTREIKNEKKLNFKKKFFLEPKLIQSPINEILLNQIPALRNIGGSGTLVKDLSLKK